MLTHPLLGSTINLHRSACFAGRCTASMPLHHHRFQTLSSYTSCARTAGGCIRPHTQHTAPKGPIQHLSKPPVCIPQAAPLITRAASEEEGAAFDEQDILADLPVPIRRRVMALRDTQQKYDDIYVNFIKERAELEAKYQKIFSEWLVTLLLVLMVMLMPHEASLYAGPVHPAAGQPSMS